MTVWLPGSPPGRPPPTHTLGLDLPRSRGVCVGEHRAGSRSAPCGPARGAVALWLARQHGVTSVGPGKPGPLFSVLMTQPSVSPQGCCGALACGPGETRRNRGWPALAEGARRLIQSSESACGKEDEGRVEQTCWSPGELPSGVCPTWKPSRPARLAQARPQALGLLANPVHPLWPSRHVGRLLGISLPGQLSLVWGQVPVFGESSVVTWSGLC